jgi:hypothetical protein
MRHTQFRVKLDGRVICRIYLDSKAIAKGIFEMMKEDDKALLAFGMINKPFMDSLDKPLTERFDELVEQKYGMAPDAIDKFVSDLDMGICTDLDNARKAFIRQIKNEVSKNLYSVAKAAGIMVV